MEKALPRDPGVAYPRCLTGRRACPPEDCGGPWGYANFIEAITDPRHEEHDELLEWVGGAFDPSRFDAEDINKRLTVP
ncbi:plasmid pRiA4b ORF-3 family protein [Streptomyces cuspidosporus]|uniref:Plasmid pRiA4b Orf3-like domain-containing protein n=1 Tax=Streptomyces cuspidosporus TaxID=66882 RepID=A0ABP5SH11_9ACTN